MSTGAGQRSALYGTLARRNRRIGRLRVLVPVLGAAVFAVLSVQIYLSSLTGRFSIGQIKVTPDSVTIDTPEYAGVLQDGSRYHVSASNAVASTRQSDIINLQDAALTIDRANGTTMQANAVSARLDTTRQLVIIEGLAEVEDSTGTASTFYRSIFDWAGQTLNSNGPVAVDYADGTELVSKTMIYDTKTGVWTFSRANVTLPSTPGENAKP